MTRLFLTIFLIGFTALGWGQTEQQRKLEQRKAEILKEIKAPESLEKKESTKEKSLLSKIYENDTKIKLSQQLINTTSKQTRLLTDEIYLNQLKINKLNRELKVLKEDYADMVLKAYKSRSQQSRIMFILSSESFLQAYKRMQYMKQYASFRKVQGEEIRTKMTEVEQLIGKLEGQKKEKVQLLAESEKQKESLLDDKKEQEKLVKNIRKDKKKYASDIKKKRQEAKDLQKQIDKLIRDAIAAANKKAAAEAKGSEKAAVASAASAAPNKIVLTKEGKLVSDNFKSNKGRLPWPVAEGYVSQHYGIHRHPTESSVEIQNYGMEITAKPGAEVRAVFNGTVGDIHVFPDTKTKTVYVYHGDFITVYSNLSSVNVKSGDKVSTKQGIGRVATSPSGKTILNFYVTQNTTYLNPESWVTPLK